MLWHNLQKLETAWGKQSNSVNVLCRSLAEMAAATSVHVVAVIEPIIQHADWFFPEGKLPVFPISQTTQATQ